MKAVVSQTHLDKHKETRKIAFKFYVFAFGFVLTYSPYLAVFGLQSSVNIEEGLGTLSLGIAYLVSPLFGLLCTPGLIRRFGCKWTLIAGEVTYLSYVTGNFYPTTYTLIPAAILIGIGEAVTWASIPMYAVYFGQMHDKFGSRIADDYVRKYIGMFTAIYQAGQLFVNVISYAVLYGNKNEEKLRTNTGLNTTVNDTAVFQDNTNHYQYCGANDCQNENVTEENIDQYVPSDIVSFYALVAFYCAMCICGTVLHICLLPDFGPGSTRNELQKCDFREEKDLYVNHDVGETPSLAIQMPSLRSTLVDTFRHFVELKQILLTPITIYYGVFLAFVFGEVTRAYSSCLLGVEQVGLGVMAFAASNMVACIAARRILRRFGRNKVFAAAFLLDLLNYLFCLLWRPQESDAYVVYLVFLAFGISDAVWKNVLLGSYADYYPENQEIAFNVWNIWTIVGLAAAFMTSSALCVSIKIYSALGLLVLSVTLYGVAEYVHRPRTLRQLFTI